MKNQFYSIKLYYNKKIDKKKVIDFLIAFNIFSKKEKINYFYSMINEAGFETLKKIKNLQKTLTVNKKGFPIITNKDEQKLTNGIEESENLLILLSVELKNNYNKDNINTVINKYDFFSKKVFDVLDLEKLELVSPFNKRSDSNVLKASYLISDLACDIIKLTNKFEIKNVPNIFLVYSFIYDIFNNATTKQRNNYINSYHKYLRAYFEFSSKDEDNITNSTKKYINTLKELHDNKYFFQHTSEFKLSVTKWRKIARANNDLLRNIDKNYKNEKISLMLSHWLFNCTMENFPRETFLVYCLKNIWN